MMSYSEASTFVDCQYKWYLQYIKNIQKPSIHLEFGQFAHKVLETREIPDEIVNPSLKLAFNISSWKNYFQTIFDEIDKFLINYKPIEREQRYELDDICGVIDFIGKHKTEKKFILIDYKFKTEPNNYEDIKYDDQLKLYEYFFCNKHYISPKDVEVGYISISKQGIKPPEILKSGKMSCNKAQMTTYELALKIIAEHNLNKDDYTDFLNYLQNNPNNIVHTIKTQLDWSDCVSAFENIKTIKNYRDAKLKMYRPLTAYKCKNCEYREDCSACCR